MAPSPSFGALLDGLLPRACAACERPATGPLCSTCTETLTPAPPDGPGVFVYAGPLATAINAAKRGDGSRAAALARVLVEGAQDRVWPIDAVTFVPAPWWRLAQRGFDLPAVLADALARQRAVPLVTALTVLRRDPQLSAGASREARLALVQGRFAARGAWTGRRLLLVDDVTTTGATLAEAARVLAAAGAAVTPLALAATP